MRQPILRISGAILLTLFSLPAGLSAGDEGGQESPTIKSLHERASRWGQRRHLSAWGSARLEEIVEAMTRDFPSDPVTLYWRAVMLDQQASRSDVEPLLRQCLTRKADWRDEEAFRRQVFVSSSILLGAIRLTQDDADEAMTLAQQAIALDPDEPRAYQLLIDACFETGRLEEARMTLDRRAGKSETVSPELFEIKVDLERLLGRTENLADDVHRRLARDPTCPVANDYRSNENSDPTPADDSALAVAVLNGRPPLESTRRSMDALGRRLADRWNKPTDPSTDLLWGVDMVLRYEIGLRRGLPIDRSEWESVRRAGDRREGDDPLAELVRDYVSATLTLLDGDVAASRATFERLARRYPGFVPALCRWAETLEADQSEQSIDEAERHWALARTIAPEHPLVRDHDRLGCAVTIEAAGVRITALAEESPLFEIGLRTGDTVIAIDGASLSEKPVVERLRAVRLYIGGPIHWRTALGSERSADAGILLID